MSRRPATPAIVGSSPALKRALDDVTRVAPTTAAVLLRGESGTGKELFAQLVHERSRRPGQFVAVNCAALPEAILESVLFGHRRGAFTGATDNQPGLVLAADGGTLFLDEVGELPLAVQAKLLRVFQQRTVMAVGDVRERPVDLRVVAASHRDLRQLVADGRFREDLFFRLATYEVQLPALRERGRDVVTIARSLLAGGRLHGAPPRSLARTAEAVLIAHRWPGNVRELENALFRAALHARGPSITANDLRAALGVSSAVVSEALAARIAALVRDDGASGSSDIAAALNAPRSTVQRLLKALVDAGDLTSTGVGKATRYRIAEPSDVVVDNRQRAALQLVERDGRVTRQLLADDAGLSLRTAGRVLAEMVEGGLLVPDGRRGSAAGYARRAAA